MMKQDVQPFDNWQIRECFPLWDIKQMHVHLNATETQKAEISRRAPPSQLSEVEKTTNGEIKDIWAHIYEDKSAGLFLPYDIPLTPDESASLVKSVETALGKSIEDALEEAKEQYIERFKEKDRQRKAEQRNARRREQKDNKKNVER